MFVIPVKTGIQNAEQPEAKLRILKKQPQARIKAKDENSNF